MSEVNIVTHNGICHSDETLAVAVLMLYFNKKGIEEIKVIRTREITEVPEDSIVVDVFGGELDHHQMAPVYEGRQRARFHRKSMEVGQSRICRGVQFG